jgi:hypothetical protein
MTHTIEDCPGYNPEKMPEFMTAYDKLDEISKQFNVKVQFLVSGLPEHVEYALVEADSPSTLALYLTQFPYRMDFKVTAVEHMHDVMTKMKGILQQT